jgi:hypothetical protein
VNAIFDPDDSQILQPNYYRYQVLSIWIHKRILISVGHKSGITNELAFMKYSSEPKYLVHFRRQAFDMSLETCYSNVFHYCSYQNGFYKADKVELSLEDNGTIHDIYIKCITK